MAEDDCPRVTAVSAGSSHTLALLSCGVCASWGRGEDGQLGHGDAGQCNAPKAIATLTDAGVLDVVCGAEYSVAVCKDVVYSWGWGDFGRLGHGDCNDVFVPRPIDFFSGRQVSHAACGDTHTLVATSDGALFTFGRNQNGQLGLGHTNDCLAPQAVTALQGERLCSVACGSEHSLAVTEAGKVYAWGWGRYGNLGDGDSQDRYLPTPVVGLDGLRVVLARCGWRHSAVVTDAGAVLSFGWSKYGQLGHGDHTDHSRPCRVAALASVRVTAVAGGWRHTVAVDDGGRLYAWGWNKFGQLGLGDTDDRCAPALVGGPLAGRRVGALACGWRHTVAVAEDGGVFSWGRGVNGQLGQGGEADLYLPTPLACLSAGTLRRDAMLATASAAAARPDGWGGLAPADRYAVVPGADEPFGSNGSGGAAAAAAAAVPSMGPNGGGAAFEVPSADAPAAGGGHGNGGGGGGGTSAGPSQKRARTSTDAA